MIEKALALALIPSWLVATSGAMAWWAVLTPFALIEEVLS